MRREGGRPLDDEGIGGDEVDADGGEVEGVGDGGDGLRVGGQLRSGRLKGKSFC